MKLLIEILLGETSVGYDRYMYISEFIFVVAFDPNIAPDGP